ncbi:hypothetical protein PRVXH_000402 [Proteinivorax hydrogeniformans]|uniref:Uncharacterized protein n=1 Tax=Proteinivorax hydrogeniformans TaxID=1826727 RepID=A0AAU8HUP1_9FIRM
MIRRFIAYQRLLLNSISTYNIKTIFLAGIILSFLMSFFGLDSLFVLPFFTLYMTYQIVEGHRKLYELVPVSSWYVVVSLFATALFMVLFAHVAMLLVVIMFMGGFMILAWLGGAEIGMGGPTVSTATSVESTLFMLLMVILILFIGTAIALIKNKKCKTVANISAFGLLIGFLYWLKISLPIDGDFYESFTVAPQADLLLTGLGMITVVAVPLSIVAGHRFYSCY